MNAYLRECIKSLRAPDDSEILRALSLLDSAGIFICPSEPLDEYIRRASRILDEIDSISCGNSQFGSIYSGASKAPGALISSAAEITWQLYRFRADSNMGVKKTCRSVFRGNPIRSGRILSANFPKKCRG